MDNNLKLAVQLLSFSALIFASRILSIVSLITTIIFFWFTLMDPTTLRITTTVLFTGLVFLPLVFLELKGGLKNAEERNSNANGRPQVGGRVERQQERTRTGEEVETLHGGF